VIPDQLATLIQRRDYLWYRIKAKQSVGWDTAYDEREHTALQWAIDLLYPQEDDGA